MKERVDGKKAKAGIKIFAEPQHKDFLDEYTNQRLPEGTKRYYVYSDGDYLGHAIVKKKTLRDFGPDKREWFKKKGVEEGDVIAHVDQFLALKENQDFEGREEAADKLSKMAASGIDAKWISWFTFQTSEKMHEILDKQGFEVNPKAEKKLYWLKKRW